MYESLKQRVYRENKRLAEQGLVVLTWGNVSEIDRKNNVVAIKPSGVNYSEMTAGDIVVVDLDGKVVDGELKPSSDLMTHLCLYKEFAEIGGIVHTHSTYAVAWAQAGLAIKPYGTTHADAFYGEVPCTRALTKGEIESDYEYNTGKVIAETFDGIDPMSIPAVVVRSHGPFTWGKDAEKAVENAIILENVAKMAVITGEINPDTMPVGQYLLDKHYYRKHGKNSYYGQGEKK